MGIYQGIDVGSKTVRKVTIKTEWNSVKLIDGVKPNKKIMSVPSNLLTFRQFKFPFQDKKRIMEILPGELMDTLAFPIDTVQWDISSIEKDTVNTFIVPREHLDAFTAANENSINVIDAEPCALARLANYNKLDSVLVIDFGANKTTFCGINNNKLDLVRVRTIAGKDLDAAVANEAKISPEDGETLKIERGMSSTSIRRAVETLINSAAIPQTFPYERIIITGGGAMLTGLREYLSDKFSVPIGLFDIPEDLSPYFDAVAFGAALYDSAGKDKINLKEEQKTDQKNLYQWFAAIALIPIILFSVSLQMKLGYLKNEHGKIRNAMTEAIRKEIPDIGPIRSPLRQVEAVVKRGGGRRTARGMDVLDILKSIADTRSEVTVTFYEMDITDTSARIKGETDSFQSVDTLRNALVRYFPGVEVVDQKTKPNGKVDFNIRLDTVKKGESK
jgi:type II secretory pathway component PulL